MIKRIIFGIAVFCSWLSCFSQDVDVLKFEEYLGYVKLYHPFVKQANLLVSEGQAKLMKARGTFDPKLEIDFDRKKFKSTEYYDKLNATFKIPTWFGIELKGNFQENTGVFLNPEGSLPKDGLYSAGVSIPVAKGFLINKRMASLRQAKLFREQVLAERQLAVNTILYDASIAYFSWLKAFNDLQVYATFVNNAQIRLDGVKKNFEVGEIPAIDTLEARIILNNRKLEHEKARIAYVKSSLELSNYLWLDNNIPIEIQDNVIPDANTYNTVDETLKTSGLNIQNFTVENHPKLRALNLKYRSQKIERRLKLNNLLPQINLEYNFLSETPEQINSFNTTNYKSGVRVNFPLFLRKERGNLKLAKLKLNDTEFEIANTRVSLKNKFDALTREINSYAEQNNLTRVIIDDYLKLLKAEERKFNLGESSLFLINSRESKLIETKLKANEIENKFFKVKAKIFQLINFDTQQKLNSKS
ncbi:TolC family protein [Snuella lapsa]|uniref:TolC family protein n=1 Tax=Snuella lapsa TaxID=870481 RepID=A0ABP6YGR7_9FLAO